MPDSATGVIFNIQHYCIHDGPGIRTNIFFKGCPLRCLWCANPESNDAKSQLLYQVEKCVGCQACLKVCPYEAIRIETNGKTKTDRMRCRNCGACSEVCLPKARSITGKMMTAEEVYREIEKDCLFYKTSGGGVTLTGGEVLLQSQFAIEILKICKKNQIHTAIETSGYATWDVVKSMMEYVDLVLYDVKHMDSQMHRYGTGVGNERILDNLDRISNECKTPIIVRTPIIPGYNDSESNMHAMGQYVSSKLGSCVQVELLPYHNMGEGKWLELEKERKPFETHIPDSQKMEQLRSILKTYGLNVV